MRRFLFGLGTILLVLVMIRFLGPRWAAYEVHRRYPYVTVDQVEIELGKVGLRRVHLNHPMATGDLDLVSRDWWGREPLLVSGGEVTVTIPTSSSTEPEPRQGTNDLPDVIAVGLRSVTVKKETGKVVFSNVAVTKLGEGKVIQFETAEVHVPGYPFVLVEKGQLGSLPPDHVSIKADKVTVHSVTLPVSVPYVEGSQTLFIEKLDALVFKDLERFWEPDEAKSIKMGHIRLSDVLELDAVDLFAKSDSLRVLAMALRLNHRWVQLEPAEVLLPLVTIPRPLSSGPIKASIGGNPPINVEIDPFKYSAKGSGQCSTWKDILPTPLPPALKQMPPEALTGTFDFQIQVKPKPTLKFNWSCKFDCSKEPMASFSRGKFTYEPYHPNGTRFSRTTGFNQEDWALITDIPPHVGDSFIRLEDPSFLKHRGIVSSALEASLFANVKAGTFTKGGSTITMQLAKNLWLPRHKTLMRKVHEAFLATALESCYSKAEILETYLNIIEFGPDIYGIKAAAKHWFNKEPFELRADEAFYLASILPKPLKAIKPEHGGLAQAQRIMTYLAEHGFISDELLDFGESKPLKVQGWETDTN